MSGTEEKYFDSDRLIELLGKVDAQLGDGEPIRVVACGGAVLALRYDFRITNDVDIISEPFPDELKQAARAVAERHGLQDQWVNDAAKISIPKLAPRFETIYQGRRLEVLSPGPRFLLAMKLAAGRDRDLEDAILLVREIGYSSIEDVLNLVETAWGHTHFSMSVEYFTRQVYELAQQEQPHLPSEAPHGFTSRPDPGTGLDTGP